MRSPLLFFDAETTGPDPDRDRIVELCLYPAGGSPIVRRINPEIPIPAEATAIHGITDDDVRDAPTFRQLARSVQEIVAGKVLVGFNSRRFDTVLLDAELRRAGQPGLDRDAFGRIVQKEIDLYQIWVRSEPRNLAAAVERFAGRKLDDAHTADADTTALPEVLDGMLRQFGLDCLSIDELCGLCVPEDEVDRARKFVRREDGVVVFNIGNVKGVPVTDDPGFLEWMLRKDFPADTKAFARQFLAAARRTPQEALP